MWILGVFAAALAAAPAGPTTDEPAAAPAPSAAPAGASPAAGPTSRLEAADTSPRPPAVRARPDRERLAVDPEGAPSEAVYAYARLLTEAGLAIGATRYHAAVARRGAADPWADYAAARLVDHARRTGDWLLFDELVAPLAEEAFPPCCRNAAHWRRGLLAARSGREAEARAHLARVSPAARDYPAARLVEGALLVREGKLKSGVRTFTDAVRAELVVDTPAQLEDANANQDLAFLNIGRVYYAIGQLEWALEYYGMVPAASRHAHRALLEASWALLRLGRPDAVDALLARLDGPGAAVVWAPEAALLRAILAFRSGQLDGAAAALDRLDAAIDPVRAALADGGARGAAAPSDAYAAADRWLSPQGPLPVPLRREWRYDGALAGLLAVRDGLDRELAALDAPQWRKEREGLADWLGRRRTRNDLALGERALALGAAERARLDGLARQAAFLRFEIADARGARPEAITRLTALIAETAPTDPLAPELAFRLAELRRDEDPVPARIARYRAVVDTWPTYARADEVLLRLAFAAQEAGDAAATRAAVEELRRAYPTSPYLAQAAELLAAPPAR